MKLTLDTQRVYLWLLYFGYRHCDVHGDKEPDGVPFRRSPEAPCDGYEPRGTKADDWGDCETDGHYLCQKCCHRKVETEVIEG